MYEHKPRSDKLTASIVHLIKNFFQRDDNSSMTPEKRHNHEKKGQEIEETADGHCQELTQIVHHKHPDDKMSYFTFLHLRPLWVVTPNILDRQTCKCRTHENIQFKASKLCELGVLSVNKAKAALSLVCCSDSNATCTHRECDACKDKRLEFAAFDPMKETRWYEWQMVDCEKKNKNTGETESNREGYG